MFYSHNLPNFSTKKYLIKIYSVLFGRLWRGVNIHLTNLNKTARPNGHFSQLYDLIILKSHRIRHSSSETEIRNAQEGSHKKFTRNARKVLN